MKTKLKSGHVVVGLSDADQKEQKDLFQAYAEGVIKLQPGGWTYTNAFEKFANKIYEFEFKPTDVVIMTFPKSGTTWVQEVLWTMMKDINNDHEDNEYPINMKCPFLEFDFLMSCPNAPDPNYDPNIKNYFHKYNDGVVVEKNHFLNIAKCAQEPRILKTHLPFSLLNPKMLNTCKVIYVVRNPKDVLVSFFHHCRVLTLHGYLGDFDKFFELFINDKMLYGPMWQFLQEGWERRNHFNFHLVFYEDLKADPLKEIKRLDHFLGTGLSKTQILNVVEYTKFDKMKERDTFACSPDNNCSFIRNDIGEFFRKGEAGSWKTEFSEQQDEIMNSWIESNLKSAPFDFKYSIAKY